MKRKSGAPDLLRAISVQVGLTAMDCIGCGSAAATAIRSDSTRLSSVPVPKPRRAVQRAQLRFSQSVSLPSDIITFVALCRLRYRLTLRDLSKIMLLRESTVSHECIRQWEAKLLPVMSEAAQAACAGVTL